VGVSDSGTSGAELALVLVTAAPWSAGRTVQWIPARHILRLG
jgi:hypothetical protein